MEILFLSESAHPESFGSVISKIIADNEANVLVTIMTRLSNIAQNGGHPKPPYAKTLTHTNGAMNEICCKRNNNELLRIYYFVDREKQKMVLLNTTIKPDGRKFASHYDGKKIEKEIREDIQEALSLKEKYYLSQNDYEPLRI